VKLFVWEYTQRLTMGMAIAPTVERARELLCGDFYSDLASDLAATPDIVRECEGPEYVFRTFYDHAEHTGPR